MHKGLVAFPARYGYITLVAHLKSTITLTLTTGMSFNRVFLLAMALAAVFAAPAPNSHLKRQPPRADTISTAPNDPPGSTTISTAPNSKPSRPWFSTYINTGPWVAANWPTPADLGDWNDLLLAFWTATQYGPNDMANAWSQFASDDKRRIAQAYRAAGKTLRVAIFGTEDPGIVVSKDPADVARKVAAFVRDNYLHGVDVDYEENASFDASANGAGERFVIQLTKSLRELLPAEEGYIISHAPQALYFSTAGQYPHGAYRTVHKEVGDLIDFYNVQFYNENVGVYEDCAGLMTADGTGVAGVLNGAGGVPRAKLVLGKLANCTLGNNGFMEPSALGECIRSAPAERKPAGLMAWAWTTDTKEEMDAWLREARADL